MYNLAIVEDETVILNGLSNFYPWEEIGFNVTIKTTNAKDLLQEIETGLNIHAVLCDISMPEMTGIELAEALHEKYPKIIVVFLSGIADFEYARTAVKLNIFEYLLKPVKYDDLVSTFIRASIELDNRKGLSISEHSYYSDLVVKIQEIVDSNLGSVSWKMISHELNMSSSYLSFLYKKETGRNFVDYLTERKMEFALKELTQTNKKIYEISNSLGYTNVKNFSRAFSQYYGKSPRDVRRGRT